ncbi:MAG: DUF4145 domain-containing protein [Chloroflexi bacterium]|nr:MAG: DUF4145 domain-containing protein [Chloroflexota bacterium]
MDRDIWASNITTDEAPPYSCPHCGVGTLEIVPKSLKKKETVASQKEHRNPDWDPEWIRYSFTAWLKCSRTECEQGVAVSGRGSVDVAYDPEEGPEWYDSFEPLHFWPTLDIINIPDKTPDDVAKELRSAFSLFKIDPSACANRIRVSLELLLDHLGVQRKKRTSGGKMKILTLHERIELLRPKNPDVCDQLIAIKWVGNTGSHSTFATTSDLLDVFEILEHALSEIVSERSKQVSKLAKKLTKKHSKRK